MVALVVWWHLVVIVVLVLFWFWYVFDVVTAIELDPWSFTLFVASVANILPQLLSHLLRALSTQ